MILEEVRDLFSSFFGVIHLCVDKTVRGLLISNWGLPRQPAKAHVTPCYNGVVLESVLSLLAAIRVFFRSRSDTALEVLALDSGSPFSNGSGRGLL